MNTIDFRTKTIMEPKVNPSVKGKWGVAVDIGYSGTKIFAPDIIASFPSFAMQTNDTRLEIAGEESPDDILYKDEKGKLWLVGKCAQDMLDPTDPNNSSMSIYGRSWYTNPMYLVIARVAIAIAMKESIQRGVDIANDIWLQTGLPNEYIKEDAEYIREVLGIPHSFDLRIGNERWQHFEFNLSPERISLIPQPLGTLLSVVTDDNGDYIPEASKYLSSAVLIVDPGFGTLDCFKIRNKVMIKDNIVTNTSLGMKEVFRRTSDEIFNQFHVQIPVPMMQKYLETGKVLKYNWKTKSAKTEDFSAILESKSKEVAEEVIDSILSNLENIGDCRYMIITGGTGEAWFDYFVEGTSLMETLEVVPGNISSGLPFIFSNVRGYYMYLLSQLKVDNSIREEK